LLDALERLGQFAEQVPTTADNVLSRIAELNLFFFENLAVEFG